MKITFGLTFVICTIWLGGFLGSNWHIKRSSLLTDREMTLITGLQLPGYNCGQCDEYEDNDKCKSPYYPSTNSCEWKGCVSGDFDPENPTDCGNGRMWTGTAIPSAYYWGEWPIDKIFTGPNNWLCDYAIVCDTGNFQPTKNCDPGIGMIGTAINPSAGSCFVPSSGPVYGCRTCDDGGQTTPISQHNVNETYCDWCPVGG